MRMSFLVVLKLVSEPLLSITVQYLPGYRLWSIKCMAARPTLMFTSSFVRKLGWEIGRLCPLSATKCCQLSHNSGRLCICALLSIFHLVGEVITRGKTRELIRRPRSAMLRHASTPHTLSYRTRLRLGVANLPWNKSSVIDTQRDASGGRTISLHLTVEYS